MQAHELSAHVHHEDGDDHNRGGERRTRWVVVLAAMMMIGELIAGSLTGSMALTADGWHMGTHALALGGAVLAYRLSLRASQHRAVAGGPASNNVLKCQLRAIAFSDYKVTFSDAEKARLAAIFPNGVCDYGKPGVEQQAPKGTWLSH